MSTRGTTELTFAPRPSNGSIWAGGLGVLVLVLTITPLIPAYDEMPFALFTFFVGLGIAIGAPLIAIAIFARSMQYVVTDDTLWLRCGPLMIDAIPVEEIKSVQHRDLKISWLSSFRFPGLALFDVPYRDIPRVRMCATAAATDILLITTVKQKHFGITPEDEAGLIAELRKRNPDIQVLGSEP